jgi:hypothetical protein
MTGVVVSPWAGETTLSDVEQHVRDKGLSIPVRPSELACHRWLLPERYEVTEVSVTVDKDGDRITTDLDAHKRNMVEAGWEYSGRTPLGRAENAARVALRFRRPKRYTLESTRIV